MYTSMFQASSVSKVSDRCVRDDAVNERKSYLTEREIRVS